MTDTALDGRTREARREEIRQQIRDHGGFSTFWITSIRRAKIATEMVASGEIVPTPKQYPWIDATLEESHEPGIS